jgi:Zn2+/Cd2+-exporting ATPase
VTPPLELPMLPSPGEAPVEPAPPPSDARRFRIDGMDCAACAKTVEKTV